MDFGIQGKVALVTAASKGLGRATAEDLSREGCRVAICARSKEDTEKAAREISDLTGNEVVPFTSDLSKEDEINNLVRNVQDRLGNPEILIVNAGGPPLGNFDDTPLERYPEAIELTLMSGVRLTHACLPAMRKQNWGRIVFISSISVKQPIPFLLLSNMTRAGLTGFMKTVANEIAESGVTLNAVLPGQHRTDRVVQGYKENPEGVKAATEQIAMKRLGEPEELAALVAFLASARASYITGSSILVDGGAHQGLL